MDALLNVVPALGSRKAKIANNKQELLKSTTMTLKELGLYLSPQLAKKFEQLQNACLHSVLECAGKQIHKVRRDWLTGELQFSFTDDTWIQIEVDCEGEILACVPSVVKYPVFVELGLFTFEESEELHRSSERLHESNRRQEIQQHINDLVELGYTILPPQQDDKEAGVQ